MVAAQKSNESALLEKREKVMLELDKLKRYDRKNLYKFVDHTCSAFLIGFIFVCNRKSVSSLVYPDKFKVVL